MSQSSPLWDESYGEVGATLKILGNCGLTPEDFKKVRQDRKFAARLVQFWKQGAKELPEVLQVPSIAYDATSILGFGPASTEPLPEAEPGEIVIRYGGWSLQELCDCTVGKEMLEQGLEGFFSYYQWPGEKLPPGIYSLRIVLPDSENEQKFLQPGEQVVHVCLAATALLAAIKVDRKDLLFKNYISCVNRTESGSDVVLFWREGRLCLQGHSFYPDYEGTRMFSFRTS